MNIELWSQSIIKIIQSISLSIVFMRNMSHSLHSIHNIIIELLIYCFQFAFMYPKVLIKAIVSLANGYYGLL